VAVDNDSCQRVEVVSTERIPLDAHGKKGGTAAADIAPFTLQIALNDRAAAEGTDA
jgi:hypothetical protein